MYTQTEENYLKALFHLADEKMEVSVNDLSKRLNIKMPSVNSMIKKLDEKGLVVYTSYKPIQLTEKGEKEAALIIRKHRLTEMYLVEKMGFSWDSVHDIAEQIEHIQSPIFFEKMDELLGYPKLDPHGAPIPNEEGEMAELNHYKLSDGAEGDKVKIVAVSDSSTAFLEFLNNRRLTLGTVVEILEVEDFDKSMKVSHGTRRNDILSHLVCEKLLVNKVD